MGIVLLCRLTRNLAVVLTVLCLVATGVLAQAPQRPFSTIVDEWNKSLGLIDQELSRQPALPKDRAQKLKERLAEIRTQTQEIEASTEKLLEPLQNRFQALGPPPAEGAPPEFEAIAEERKKLTTDITLYEGRIKQTALTRTRSDELSRRIKTQTFEQAIEALVKPSPWPLAPGTIAIAVPEFLGFLGSVVRSPLEWWHDMAPTLREQIIFSRVALVVGLALALGFSLRLALRRWFGRDPTIEHPTYARRLSAGIFEGLASGIIPALIFGGFLFWVTSEAGIISGLFAETMVAFCTIVIFLVLTYALSRAVLAPELPAWRLVPLSPHNARAINRRIVFLACVFSADLFFELLDRREAFSDELISLFEFLITTLEVGGVLALVRSHLWTADLQRGRSSVEPAEQTTSKDAPGGQGRPVFGSVWQMLRFVIIAIALSAAVATFAGYANLGAYLSESLLASGVVLGGLFLVRGLIRELIGAALRSTFMRDRLAVGHSTRSLFKFWIRALLDVVAYVAGVFLILSIWGVPLGDMWSWTKQTLLGITIGNVTISITDILTALVIFVMALLVTRILQRLLTEKVLPQTSLDVGLRHSLTAGFGYVGLVIAVSLGIAAMGLDLTNLALIFGALSVGIGFGLQNIVNNFVSGITLLIERPIKVGDWVVVGANEGFVKRIHLRATEIETFQRASILIPNSEIISNAVVNWTYKDRYGRVDVPVRVAYGSDVEQVMEVLNRCLRDNHEIVDWPAPFVLFRSLGESALEFEARGYIANIERLYQVQSDVLTAIERALREADITIPFPQRDLHVKNFEDLADAIKGRHLHPDPAGRSSGPPRLREVEGGGGEGRSDG